MCLYAQLRSDYITRFHIESTEQQSDREIKVQWNWAAEQKA